MADTTRIETSYNLLDFMHPARLGPFLLPPRYKVRVDDPQYKAVFTISVVVEGGRPVCEQVVADRREGGPPLRGKDLRVPLGGFLRHTAIDVAHRAAKGQSGEWLGLSDADVPDFYRTYVTAERGARTPKKSNEGDHERVAVIYRAAVADGVSPAARIAAEFVISEEYARKKVRAARDAGALGPALRGKAGEGATDAS